MSLNRIADDLYQVKLPLPFALRSVNCYLLRDAEGWAIIDTGINTPEGRATWEAAFQELGILPRHLTRIFLTHVHPDHFGLAGWLQGWSGQEIPIFTSAIERSIAEQVWFSQATQREFAEHLRRGGLQAEFLQAVYDSFLDTLNMTYPHPAALETVNAGETLQIGARTFQLHHGSGHSDGQLLFYDAADRVILAGDQVLMGITPNVGLWANADPNPLRHFMESLRTLENLSVRLGLAGHKADISDWGGRIRELIAHHEMRLDKTRVGLQAGAGSAYEVAHHLFDVSYFTVHEWRFAIAETLAHLEYLRDLGEVTLYDEDIWRYSLV